MVENFLGECYRLDVLQKDNKALDWLINSPYIQNMKEEARTKLAEIEHIPPERCFITKKYVEYLKRLLT